MGVDWLTGWLYLDGGAEGGERVGRADVLREDEAERVEQRHGG